MLRGYRNIIFALGLLLSSPGHSQESKSDQAQAGNVASNQLERIVAAVEKSQIAAAPDRGCKSGEDNRQSDLCAQWKAADSAAESARWALWMLWVSGLGIFLGAGTLIAAWRAAHWAKEAARHTETSAEEAKKAANATIEAVAASRESNRIANEAQRPWLSASARWGSSFRTGRTQAGIDGFYADITCSIKNHGGSPAANVNTAIQMIIPGPGVELGEALRRFCDDLREMRFVGGPAIFSGQEIEVTHMVFVPQSTIDEAVSRCGDFKMISAIVLGCVSYNTSQVSGTRQTRFLYHVVVDQNGKAMAITPDHEGWWNGKFELTAETIHVD